MTTMPLRALAIAVLTGTLGLAGCGSSSNSPGGGEEPPPPPPPPPTSVTFPALVLGVLGQTSDTTEPVPINGLSITFPNNDSPVLFDSVLAPP
jgi:hypothetical protein